LARTFSIITTCKGRLDHLKQTLPKMLGQGAKDVIVVDFSCPQGTGEWVTANFPAARVVAVRNQDYFSNWKARNAGASVANSDVLAFVDADTFLAEDAIDRLSKSFPEQAFGYFDRKASRASNKDGPRLGANQLKGFHVIPTAAFRRLGGYDEVLEGYAAGADTDLEERLIRMKLAKHVLDSAIVESVIQHDAASRTEHHAEPVSRSYGAGLLYRAAKRVLLRVRGEAELPLRLRQNLYEASRNAVGTLGTDRDSVILNVTLGQDPIMMPRQLGYERGVQSVSLRVELSLEEKLAEIPE
jgi:hypothetical protein